jgi:hypothetical protein
MITSFIAYCAIARTSGLAGNWEYRAFDAHKASVAQGRILLNADPKRPGGFKGSKWVWQSQSEWRVGPHGITSKSPPKAIKPVDIDASLRKGHVLVEMNKGSFDHNIRLSGELKGDSIAGSWGHATFAGIREHGTFTLLRSSPIGTPNRVPSGKEHQR